MLENEGRGFVDDKFEVGYDTWSACECSSEMEHINLIPQRKFSIRYCRPTKMEALLLVLSLRPVILVSPPRYNNRTDRTDR